MQRLREIIGMKELCGLSDSYTYERLVILLLLASHHLALCFPSRQLFIWSIHLCSWWKGTEVSPDT